MRRAAVAVLVVLGACAGILGIVHPASTAFPHRAHAMAGVACTTCHANIGAGGPAALHLPSDASCLGCHAKPHDEHPCLGCHVADGALAELADARDHLVFDHARHAEDCMHCHVGIAEGDAHLRPPMATCFKCHAHEAARDARACATCHRDLEDAKLVPASHLAHDGNWLREHGARAASAGDACQTCHREKFCAECHGVNVPALPATLHFADPFTPSVHRAGFSARHAREARAEPGACLTCHAPERCETCHLAKGIAGGGRRSPHPANWVGIGADGNQHGREARRDPVACAACHDGAGQALCVGCHRVGGIGGNPHPAGWSSRLPLTALPCRLCHAIGARP